MTTENRTTQTCGLCGWPADKNGFCHAHSWAAHPDITPAEMKKPKPKKQDLRKHTLTQAEAIAWWQRRYTPDELADLAWQFKSLQDST